MDTLGGEMEAEEQEDAYENAYLCYRCGHNLIVGENEGKDLCWHCVYDEEEIEQEGM